MILDRGLKTFFNYYKSNLYFIKQNNGLQNAESQNLTLY